MCTLHACCIHAAHSARGISIASAACRNTYVDWQAVRQTDRQTDRHGRLATPAPRLASSQTCFPKLLLPVLLRHLARLVSPLRARSACCPCMYEAGMRAALPCLSLCLRPLLSLQPPCVACPALVARVRPSERARGPTLQLQSLYLSGHSPPRPAQRPWHAAHDASLQTPS